MTLRERNFTSRNGHTNKNSALWLVGVVCYIRYLGSDIRCLNVSDDSACQWVSVVVPRLLQFGFQSLFQFVFSPHCSSFQSQSRNLALGCWLRLAIVNPKSSLVGQHTLSISCTSPVNGDATKPFCSGKSTGHRISGLLKFVRGVPAWDHGSPTKTRPPLNGGL